MAENNQVVATTKNKGIADYLTAPMVRKQIENVIGKTNSQRFVSSIISAVSATPALANCTQKSILNCALLGETLGLSPSPQMGQMYMVPYSNKGVSEAQFQLGYKGYIQMAIRTGEYQKLVAEPIKEGEFISWNALEEEIKVNLVEDETKRAKLKTVGYYGMFLMNNGFKKSIYWTYDKMLDHANKYSKGFAAKKGYTFWEKDFDAMARKTIIRQLISKWGVMSNELQRAFQADMGVINDINDKSEVVVDYIDNPEVDSTTGEVKDDPIVDVQKEIITQYYKGDELKDVLNHYGVEKVEDLSVTQASEICTYITSKKK